jgi:xanthine dehydrogenase accessory factor
MDIYQKIVKLIDAGASFAVGLVLNAEGSTPRKAAVRAVIDETGKIWGTLGGGLVEAEAQRRAVEACRTKRPIVFDMLLHGANRAADDPICGGAMRILLDPTAAKDRACYARVAEAIRQRRRGVLLTTLRTTEGTEVTPRWFSAESISANLPFPGEEEIRACLAHETPQLFVERSETNDVLTEVLVEPVIPKPHLLIAGGGHVGQALALQADLVGFDVTVIDDRPEFTDPSLFPPETATRCGDIPKEIAALIAWRGRPGLASRRHVSRASCPRFEGGTPSTRQGQDALATVSDTYIVIVTRGHKLDAETLQACIHAPVTYIGMIGSRRKVSLLRENFIQSGLATEKEFDRVFTPVGLGIGAVTVPEIAASITAELIAVRRKGIVHASSKKAELP